MLIDSRQCITRTNATIQKQLSAEKKGGKNRRKLTIARNDGTRQWAKLTSMLAIWLNFRYR